MPARQNHQAYKFNSKLRWVNPASQSVSQSVPTIVASNSEPKFQSTSNANKDQIVTTHKLKTETNQERKKKKKKEKNELRIFSKEDQRSKKCKTEASQPALSSPHLESPTDITQATSSLDIKKPPIYLKSKS